MNTKDIVVGKMIRYFLTQEKMTMKELGNKLGKTESTVSKWVSGASTPMAKDLSAMTFIFNTDINTLMYGGEQNSSTILTLITETSAKLEPSRQEKVYNFAKNELEEQNAYVECDNKIQSLQKYREMISQAEEQAEIDWYGCASAGTGEFIFDNKEIITLPKKQIPLEADFCLTVNGDSMEPLIHDQDYIFVSKQNTLFNGTIGVVIVNGEAFIKKIFFEDHIARLKSFNKKYKDIIINNTSDFRIVGKVVL